MAKVNRKLICWQVIITLFSLQLTSVAAAANELDCVIEPHLVIDLSSRVDGIVDSIEVDRGQFIDEDQVLVKLEAGVEHAVVAERRARAEAMAEVLAGRTSVAFAARRNGRIEELHRSQAVSTDQLDEINTEKELSRLQLRRAQENKQIAELELRQALEVLERHTLRSPINGVVVQRYLAPGESVEDQPIMRIAQIDPLRVEVIVPVAAFGSIKVGQTAIIRPEPPMAGEFPATVSVVDGVADAASGTFRVRLTLPNSENNLASGLKCRVAFEPVRETSDARVVAAKDPAPDANLVSTSPQGNVPTANPVPALPQGNVPTANPVPALPDSIVPGAGSVSAAVSRESSLAPAGPKTCKTIGPIKDAPAARQIMKSLAPQVTKIAVREDREGEAEFYAVLAPQQASPKDTIALTEQMLADGIKDFRVIWRGPNKGRVSLGNYANEAMAQKRNASLADQGFEAELVGNGARRSRYWLDVELRPRLTALDLASVTESLSSAELTSTPCDDLVAKD